MRKTNYILVLAVGLCLGGVVWGANDEKAYVVEEQGRGTWSAVFDAKQTESAKQWEYARETQNKGRLKKADRRMLYLVRRWPNSKEAPWAQRARADMLYSRGKLKDAFKEYQYLIDNYSSRMRDYDSVLDSQFKIAIDIMKRKRMRWFFGGYRAPEYSVDYFEDVIRNGPQWEHAPEAQSFIGQAYQDSGELELAIAAYAVLGYRYPESPFAEDAAWQQIACLDLLRKDFPNSRDILDRILTATTVFKDTFPTSAHKSEVTKLRNTLYEVMAQKAFDEAAFYAKVPKKPASAITYYELMIAEFPKSKLVSKAEERIVELEALLNMRTQAPASTLPPTLHQPVMEKGSNHAQK